MRKRLAQFRKLGRTPEHKWAMLRNMVTSLIKHERIVTTVPKAKELRTLADKVIGYAKKGNMASQQRAMRIIREKPACTKLFDILGPRYEDRDGGYTRVMKLSQESPSIFTNRSYYRLSPIINCKTRIFQTRKGDNAPMAVIEYVDRPGEIRAARVPQKRKERYFNNLKEVMEHAGIKPISGDGVGDIKEEQQK